MSNFGRKVWRSRPVIFSALIFIIAGGLLVLDFSARFLEQQHLQTIAESGEKTAVSRPATPIKTNIEVELSPESLVYNLPYGEIFDSVYEEKYEGVRVVTRNIEPGRINVWALSDLRHNKNPRPLFSLQEQ